MRSSSPKVTYLKDYKVTDYLIEHVDLTIELDDERTLVKARLSVKANPAAMDRSRHLLLHGENLVLNMVLLNDRKLDAAQYEVTDDGLLIRDVPEHCIIEIHNTINPAANTALKGLYISRNTYTTHCEAEGFRTITYFLDRPDVMATYTTTIIADEGRCPVMLSNGNPAGEGKTDDGRRWVTWKDPFKKPSYLFALVAGDLRCLEDHYLTQSGRRVELKIYAEATYIDNCRHAMDSLKSAMHWDEINYGRECDLDSYKIVAVNDFNIGAMENKGLNIFNALALLASPATATDERFMAIQRTVAHEYFHNWTGDRITCREWFQISVKEGLTSFRDQSFAEDISTKAARAGFVQDLRTRQFPEDAGPLAHPVQPQSYIKPDNFYTSTIYRKGAEIFRMLQSWLGPETFRRGMDIYFERHDGQAVTIEQYIKALEDASGEDLSQFMLWFHQSGTPVLEVSDEYHEDTQSYILRFRQSCPPTPGQAEKKPLPIPVSLGLLDIHGRTLPLYIDGAKQPQEEAVLLLTAAEEEFCFGHIIQRPLPSLLRNFSAPVIMHYNYDEGDYHALMRFDTDAFNRLEAAQRYIMVQLQELIKAVEHQRPMMVSSDFINTFQAVLLATMEDCWLQAEMLTIPSEYHIAGQLPRINVDAIHVAREFLVTELARQLHANLSERYQYYQSTEQAFESAFNNKEAGRRRMKNLCLTYLLTLRHADIQVQAYHQFESAVNVNLTNAMAVLKNIATLRDHDQRQVLQAFYQHYHQVPHVFIYWFMVQAASAVGIDEITRLLEHPELDLRNPNAVNALLRGFCENMSLFHTASGDGYQLLSETILALDAINPKISSGQVQFLANWRQFDESRRGLMCASLQFILRHDISQDLYELVSKSLGEENLGLNTRTRHAVSNGFFAAATTPAVEDRGQVNASRGYCTLQ